MQIHIPGYVRDYEKLRAKGVDLGVCIAVNDPYVMDAWGKALNAEGKVRGRRKACGRGALRRRGAREG